MLAESLQRVCQVCIFCLHIGEGRLLGYLVPLQCNACLKSMAPPPCILSEHSCFLSLKGWRRACLPAGLVAEALPFLKMHGRVRCSILQSVKMPWRPLLLFPESRGGTSPRDHQGRTLGALGTPHTVAASSPHQMRSGSAGCAAVCGLCSQQIVVLPFPTVLHVNQHVALKQKSLVLLPF